MRSNGKQDCIINENIESNYKTIAFSTFKKEKNWKWMFKNIIFFHRIYSLTELAFSQFWFKNKLVPRWRLIKIKQKHRKMKNRLDFVGLLKFISNLNIRNKTEDGIQNIAGPQNLWGLGQLCLMDDQAWIQ